MPRDRADLYEKILRLNPDMWRTALVVSNVRDRLQYPITTYDDLLKLADVNGELDLDGTRLSSKHLKAFFPNRFFPIENEDELIGKLLAAFMWGSKSHQLTAQLQYAYREVKR